MIKFVFKIVCTTLNIPFHRQSLLCTGWLKVGTASTGCNRMDTRAHVFGTLQVLIWRQESSWHCARKLILDRLIPPARIYTYYINEGTYCPIIAIAHTKRMGAYRG